MSYIKGIFINEFIKRKKRILLIINVYTLFVTLLLVAEMNTSNTEVQNIQNDNWQSQQLNVIQKLEDQAKALSPEDSKFTQINNQLSIAQFQLKENINPQPTGALHWNNSDMTGMTIKYFIPLIIIIIGADLLSAEISNGTMKVLLLSPAGRIRLYWGKLLFLCSISFMLTLIIQSISFLIGLIKDKKVGLFDSYVLINQSGELFTMKSWLFTLTGVGLNLLSIIFISSIVLFISLFFSSSPTFSVLLSFIAVLILDSILALLRHITSFINYYPIFHIDLVSHLQGNFNGLFNLTGSILLIFAYSILLIFGGTMFFKRWEFVS